MSINWKLRLLANHWLKAHFLGWRPFPLIQLVEYPDKVNDSPVGEDHRQYVTTVTETSTGDERLESSHPSIML